MTTLELLEYIAAERAALAGCYPLPSPLDCVRYALTELGEYEDAMLRAERTGDKRNNQKPSDARRELGQVGEMLGAAANQLRWIDFVSSDITERDAERFDWIADILSALVIAYEYRCMSNHSAYKVHMAFLYWVCLVKWHGWDPNSLLVERYAQVREKHCTEVQP